MAVSQAVVARPIELVCHSSELGQWESAVARPHPVLRPYVREYVGGSERTFQPLIRRELPSEIAPVIFNFGAPFRIYEHDNPAAFVEHSSFATGAFDQYVRVGSTGSYSCVQVNFTILGARLFLGIPLRGLTNRVVSVEAVLDRSGRALVDALGNDDSWAARFDRLDAEIMRRIHDAQLPSSVTWAMHQLVRRHGQVSIGTLASDAGWSHRHFVKQFQFTVASSKAFR